MKPVCRHCANPKRSVSRPRGLCLRCYYTPGVKEMYPSTSKFASSGYGLRPPKAMPEPTQAKPCTPEKLAVLEERAKNGQHLWHPDDATN